MFLTLVAILGAGACVGACAVALTRGRSVRALGALVALATVAGAAALAAPGPAATVTVPVLVAIRAAANGGVDRVVFEFRGGLPRQVRVAYVRALIQDGSGLRIAMPGRAILEVRAQQANAHDLQGHPSSPDALTVALRNVMRVKRAGDFEAVLSYGIGVAQRRPFRLTMLHNPDRVVVEIDNRLRVVARKVFFMNLPKFRTGRLPDVTAVMRWVPAATPATGVMDRLFAGPTAAEYASGLRLVASAATGFAGLSISGAVARVTLNGGCASGGSTFTIANEIAPTLGQFAGVSGIKIFDPAGQTEQPGGQSSSIPACLEP